MVETQKELTLDEIASEMNRLRLKIIDLSEKLNIGFFELRPVTWKDVMVKSSFKGDVMLNSMIKKEDTQDNFESVKQSYNEYRQLMIDKLAEMIETKPIEECIAYVRDKLGWKWDDIGKLFNFSSRHCKRLYKLYKQSCEMSQDVPLCP